jgi:pimeloyl-ACP methyl ester carboxylesterase
MRLAKATMWIVAALLLAAGAGFLLRPASYFDEMMYLHEAVRGVKSRTVQVQGYRVHYLEEGPPNGETVVLVHGLGASAEAWRNLAPYLAKAGFHVFIPDLPGYGRSQRPADFSYSVRDEATVVIGFMDALGLKQVDLAGWSMGGWIVQIIAGEAPERIKRLLLFDSVGLHVMPDWDTSLFTPATAGQLNQLEALLTPHPESIPWFVSRDILRLTRERGWVVRRAMASMLAGSDVTDSLLPNLKMPVLIAWGAEDRIAPLEQGEKMHQLVPQSELDVVPGCGHLAPVECTGQMGPDVVKFLKH